MSALKWLQRQVGVKAPWVVERLEGIEHKYVKRGLCVPVLELDKVNEWLLKHISTKLLIDGAEFDSDPVANLDWLTLLLTPGWSVCCDSAGGVWNSIQCNYTVCCNYDYQGFNLWLTDNSSCYSTYGYNAGASPAYGSNYITYSASVTPSSSFTVQGVVLAAKNNGSSCASVTCQSNTCPNCDMPILYNQVNVNVSANTTYSVAYQITVM